MGSTPPLPPLDSQVKCVWKTDTVMHANLNFQPSNIMQAYFTHSKEIKSEQETHIDGF